MAVSLQKMGRENSSLRQSGSKLNSGNSDRHKSSTHHHSARNRAAMPRWCQDDIASLYVPDKRWLYSSGMQSHLKTFIEANFKTWQVMSCGLEHGLTWPKSTGWPGLFPGTPTTRNDWWVVVVYSYLWGSRLQHLTIFYQPSWIQETPSSVTRDFCRGHSWWCASCASFQIRTPMWQLR